MTPAWKNNPLKPLWVKANHGFYHAWDSVTVYSTAWLAEGQGTPLCGENQPADRTGFLWTKDGPPEGQDSYRCEACVKELILRGFNK